VLVSVDSTELQRATLERKKADELAVIANALGVKPGSRTKKADLVEMILAATRGGGSAPMAVSAEAVVNPAADGASPVVAATPAAAPGLADAPGRSAGDASASGPVGPGATGLRPPRGSGRAVDDAGADEGR
jgi:hypothetical protein